MTRTTNSETLSNNDRYTYANTTGAEVLVSVHMNGASDPSTDYTTTLFGKWRKDKELANTVFGSLSTLPAAGGTGKLATRTPYSFASGVLLKSNMPATIAETVFITNDKEAQLLSNGTGTRQQQIAESLEAGIEKYLTRTNFRSLQVGLARAVRRAFRCHWIPASAEMTDGTRGSVRGKRRSTS